MPFLLDHMPFLKDSDEIVVRGERVRVRANQIIIWISLSLKWMSEPNPKARPFPAILDTGFTHSFAIQESQLVEWAGLLPESLRIFSAVRDRGHRLFLRNANIWVHPNQRRERELVVDRPPQLMTAPLGIAVYPDGDFPRLPILGLRAIAENGLILNVNGKLRQATLRTAGKWRPFG